MHMGFSPGWTAARIDNEIIIPWFNRRIEFGSREPQGGSKTAWG